MATNSIKLLTGNSYPELASKVADRYVLSFLKSLDFRHLIRHMYRS